MLYFDWRFRNPKSNLPFHGDTSFIKGAMWSINISSSVNTYVYVSHKPVILWSLSLWSPTSEGDF